MPIKYYNYSYIQKTLKNHNQIVSLQTIIKRAKGLGFYINKPNIKYHDHEVLTNYIGQIIQHDSSYHKFSPYANDKWYLITSMDDYSRFILCAALREITITHIFALEAVFLQYGLPFSYYVDCHSIFRFVRGRYELHYQHHLYTDETTPQWKQVLDDCNVKTIYALSASKRQN